MSQNETRIFYDYKLYPCGHTIKALRYKPVELLGMIMCQECKTIRMVCRIGATRY